jgi:hypothetical protein
LFLLCASSEASIGGGCQSGSLPRFYAPTEMNWARQMKDKTE